MGLDKLYEDPSVEVTFADGPGGGVIRSPQLEDVDALVLLKSGVTADILKTASDLKIVARFGAGFDSVDIGAATEQGVVVTNAPQGMRHSVAQATVGMLIVCASHMRRYDRIVREQGFEDRLENMGIELFEKTLGTIGLGQIGSRVVELLEPFNMSVQTYDPYLSEKRAKELGVELVDLEGILKTSDFISIHCPLTEETYHILDEGSFEMMNENAYLVNTTRGGIYPDEDLADALSKEQLAGAAIDVFENEPDVEGNPLLDHKDVLVMPHAAGINRDGLSRTGGLVSESIISVKNGSVPMNVVNPDVFESSIPDEKISPSYR